MKLERLLEMITLLLNRRTITSRELAERFEVSARTIYRDVETLSAAGVPIYMSKGNGGGISLSEQYILNKSLLSERERDSLLLVLKTMQAIQYPEADKLLEKLKAVFKHSPTADWVEADISPWGSTPTEQSKFQNIKNAIVNRQVIAFDYVNANGESGNRAVEPLKLLYKGSAWYLIAHCRKRGGQRMFRLSRIKRAVTTGEGFDPRLVQDWEQENREAEPPKVRLSLRFQPEVLCRLYDDFDDTIIQKNPDGTFRVEIDMMDTEWLYGYLLSYGASMEVLEPERVRRIVAERLQRALFFYPS